MHNNTTSIFKNENVFFLFMKRKNTFSFLNMDVVLLQNLPIFGLCEPVMPLTMAEPTLAATL